MQIQVIIRNETPIFSAAPGKATVSLEGEINTPRGGFPLTRTRTMPVAADTGEGVLKLAYIPVVPSNTMRNLLRRTMLTHVIEPTLKDKGGISISAYAAAYAGNASGNPDGIPGTYDEIVSVRNHPFLGLFGGGPRMMEGRLKVGNLYPLHTNATRILGDGYEDRMIRGKITDVVWMRRVDPVYSLREDSQVEAIKGGVKEANAWITEGIEASRVAAEKKKKSKASDTPSYGETDKDRGLTTLIAHEVVIPGIDWIWTVNLDKPTDAQVGMILLALSNMPSQNIAGGHSKDYGRFTIQDIMVDNSSVFHGGSLSDSTTEYIDAMTEAVDKLDTADFESFAKSAKEDKKKEAK